tara:strand:- start:1560 stop:2138 length:579 start_codon:yes stop_codon:yes gene_type:complete
MKPGQIVKRFSVKNKEGKKLEVVFRFPRTSDAKEAMHFINDARDEAEFLGRRKHETLATEKKFLSEQLKNTKQNNGVFLFVEINGKIVGDASIMPCSFDTSPHVGKFGIALREAFTGLGIGSRLMQKILQLAKKNTKFRIIESGYFSPNTRSKKLHKKFGFKQCGKWPTGCQLKDGSYCDHIDVFKQIGKLD